MPYSTPSEDLVNNNQMLDHTTPYPPVGQDRSSEPQIMTKWHIIPEPQISNSTETPEENFQHSSRVKRPSSCL